MPKSISSVNSSRTAPAEWFLALISGSDRAAAILGDLTEMAATRGRLWFWMAYARTLFSLTWRIVLALVVGTVGRQIIVNSFHSYMAHTPAAWRTTDAPPLLNFTGPLLGCIMSTIWFVLPFAAVRYGLRDRFVRLAFAVALGTLIVSLYIPFASLLCAMATLAIAAAALLSRTWRRPLEVLLWTGGAGFLAIVADNTVETAIFSHYPSASTRYFFAHYGAMLIFRSSLLVVAVVCSHLHARLLQPKPPSLGALIA